MKHRVMNRTKATVVLVLVATLRVVAQSGVAPEPALTPDGQPHISGIFTFRTLTPLQRPLALEGQDTLSLEEAATFEATERTRLNRDLFDPVSGAPSAGYQSRAEGGVLSYNEFWYERGVELTKDKRTSLVVDPPDGRIPFREAYQAGSRIRRLNNRNGFADSYTDRTLADRCIMGFNAGPPMVSSAYNNNVHILQVPGYVVIYAEMIHDTRIIPLSGGNHLPTSVRLWHGDARGRWDGNSLVVETTNLRRTEANAAAVGGDQILLRAANGRTDDTITVTERFTRIGANTLDYEFTIEDPTQWTTSFSGEFPFTAFPAGELENLFEYACHEGNYSMTNILGGEREKEKALD